tara:strand:- start:4051 stop:4329 length:279 start_codon:yes stop_codon:yes gene_type:complete
MDRNFDFHGAKAAFFVEDLLLAYRRDNVSEIPFSNMWDLPGGGRENDESGAESIARETFEKFGIRVDISELQLVERYDNWRGEGKQAQFFLG